MLRRGGNGRLGYVWLQATWYQREVLHPHVQRDATIMKLLPTERKNNLIKEQNKCTGFEIPSGLTPYQSHSVML